jgi:hypothetical protein
MLLSNRWKLVWLIDEVLRSIGGHHIRRIGVVFSVIVILLIRINTSLRVLLYQSIELLVALQNAGDVRVLPSTLLCQYVFSKPSLNPESFPSVAMQLNHVILLVPLGIFSLRT